MPISILDTNIEDVKVQAQKNFFFYRPTPKQSQFHEASLCAKERLFLGGNRTGKTNAVCMELAFHLTGVYPEWWNGYRFSRPINAISASISLKDTRDILQKKLFACDIDGSMPPLLHESYIVEKTHTNVAGAWDTVWIKHVSGGKSELKFKAFQQGESSWQGVKADFIHMDELPNFKVYQEALVRISEFDNEKTFLVASMWPEKGKDELIAHFMDHSAEGEVKDGRFYIMASWQDNPYLKPETVAHLRKSIPKWQLEAREHGIPVFGQGKVFTMLEPEIFVKPFEIPKHFSYVYGLDPSASSGGTWGCVVLAYDRDASVVYVVRDYKLSNATPTEHANNILSIVPDWCTGMVDPAGAGENMHTKEKTLDSLKWEDVQLDQDCIHLKDSKNGKQKIVPLHSLSKAVLEQMKPRTNNPYVFCGKKPGAHLTDPKKTWSKIRKELGLEDVRMHDLRHTFASMAIKAGLGLYQVAKLLGHSNVQTTMRYAHIEREELVKNANIVESLYS